MKINNKKLVSLFIGVLSLMGAKDSFAVTRTAPGEGRPCQCTDGTSSFLIWIKTSDNCADLNTPPRISDIDKGGPSKPFLSCHADD